MTPGDKIQAFLHYPNTRWHRAVYVRGSEQSGHVVVRLEDGTEEDVYAGLIKPDDSRPLPNDAPIQQQHAGRKPCAWLVEYDVGDVPTHWVTFSQDAIEPYVENLCRSVNLSNIRVTALFRSSVTTPYPKPETKKNG